MAQKLSPEQNQHIIELLIPFMTIEERHDYIDAWCIGYPNLYSQINWLGTNRAFTTHIVTLFLRHGSVKSGKPALQHLLESVHKSMGLEDQAEVDTILHILEETRITNNVSRARGISVPKPLASQSSHTQNSYEHIILWFTKLNNRFVMPIVALLVVLGFISVVYLDTFNSWNSKPTTEMLSAVDTMSQSTAPITPTISPHILIVTSTPMPIPTHVIITPAEMPKNISTSVQSYCTSLVGYNTQEEIKSVLASGLGFDGPLNELRFYNGDIFGEVCATQR